MSKGTGQVRNETQTQTQNTGPWSGQAPYLRNLYESAADLPKQRYYRGQTVADQSPETQQALGMTTSLAQGGANQPRVNQWNQTLQGDYLYGNPGFNAALNAGLNAAHQQIAPMVQGQFEAGGRYGSGLAQEAETSALANAFANAFAGQYGQERQNQMHAMGMASPAYTDASALGQVGAQQDAYQQALLSDQLNRWNFAQQAPYDRLAAQNAVIQGGFPGSTAEGVATSYGKPGLLDIFGADLKAGLTNPFGDLANIWDRLGTYDGGEGTMQTDI